MKRSIQRNSPANRGLWRSGLLFLAVSVMIGCGGHYGRLAPSAMVKMQVEGFKVLPDHRYYYSGSAVKPRALIGIHESFTLKSDLWMPVKLTSDQLQDWVEYYGPNAKYFKGKNGADILSDDGRKIGIWYAFEDRRDWAAVKMIDEHTVSISTPIFHDKPFTIMNFGAPMTAFE